MAELGGRTVLVTGAAGNIGRASARLLASRGAQVVVADLAAASEELEATRARCAGEAHAITFDVIDRQAVEAAVAAAVERVGPIDGLVNNAGYQGDFANTLDYAEPEFRRVLDINVLGVFNVLQVVAAQMAEAGRGGSIVNLASMAGVTGAPNMVAYSASKAAVIGMSKSAARDLAEHRIRVNAVSPAFIGPGAMWERQVRLQAETPSIYFADDPDRVAEQMIGAVPLRRYGTLAEVAEVVAFLLSDRSSYLTALNLEVAGGAA